MNKKLIIAAISLIILIFIFVGIYSLRTAFKNQIIKEIEQYAESFGANPKVSFEDASFQGFIMPNGIVFEKFSLDTDKYRFSADKINAKVIDDSNSSITSTGNIAVENIAISNNQSLFKYRLSSNEEVEYKFQQEGDSYILSANFGNVFLYETAFDSYLIEFNPQKTPFVIERSDVEIKKIQFEDTGFNIYKNETDSKILLSESRQNIISIVRENDPNNQFYKILISSKDNKVLNHDPETSSLLKENPFNFNFSAIASSQRNGEAFSHKLEIDDLTVDFYNINFFMNANFMQDSKNVLPFGKFRLKFNNYKIFFEEFFDLIEESELPENAPKPIIFSKNNRDLAYVRTIDFLEKINGNKTDFLEIFAEREPQQFPLINNLTFENLLEIYNSSFSLQLDSEAESVLNTNEPNEALEELP